MGERGGGGPWGFLARGRKKDGSPAGVGAQQREEESGKLRAPLAGSGGFGDQGTRGRKRSAVLGRNPGPTWGGGGSSGVAGSARPAWECAQGK